MELEEKKRKRWDAQRIRELRTIERMEWKAVQKEMAKWAHIVTTYSPEPNDSKFCNMYSSCLFSIPRRFEVKDQLLIKCLSVIRMS